MNGTLLIYGANGYTGELVAREAVRQGLSPVLAGRSAARLGPLAAELGLEARIFGLDDPGALQRGLAGVAVVLHCAGPFSATAAPMISACLAARAHYLDITGEIDVFELAHARDAEARAAGVLLCPGVGFDVVPTDCVAATLKQALPDATRLALGFDSRSRMSRGTAATSVESLGNGCRLRENGELRRIPLGSRHRRIDFGDGEKLAMAIPWGDVSTAYRSTGIPNIEVYVPASPKVLGRMRWLDRLGWLVSSAPMQALLKRGIRAGAPGPTERERERSPVYVWGEAVNGAGDVRVARIRVANGYTVTVHAALAIARRLLRGGPTTAGFTTPAQLMGQDFVATLPGSTRIVVS
ncbi:MAG TPA: saccharopine dehydrogenase NADP-binding domain-containing protein [Gammaproteobacteria bacterium]